MEKFLINEEEKLRILDIHKKNIQKEIVNEDIKNHFGKVRKLMGLPLLTESIGKIWADLANATKRSDLSADQIYVLDNIIKGDAKLLSAGIKSVDDFIANKNTAFSIIKATSQNTNTLLKQGIEKIYGARLSSDYVSMNDVLRTKLDTLFGSQPIFRSLITNKFSDVTESSLRTFKSIIDTNIKNNTTMSDMVKDYLRKMSDDIGSYLNDIKITTDDIKISDIPTEKVVETPSWVKDKWMVTTDHTVELTDLKNKAKKFELTPFDPNNVKIVNGPNNLYGREVVEIEVSNGDRFLIYKSTGTGAPELKQSGDWQVIAGFIPRVDNLDDVRWFIKDVETTQLTKGKNIFFTEMDEYLKTNGLSGLSKKTESTPISPSKAIENIKTQTVNNFLSGKRVSSRWAYWKPDYIDFSKMSNIRDIETLDKQIAYALKTGNYGYIPRKGFEKFGVDDLRKLFTDGVAQINRANPETGDWSVNFK